MNSDEMKRFAKEIAERSVDYTDFRTVPAEANAYVAPAANVNDNVESVGEGADELTRAISRWVSMEIEKNNEMAVIRSRLSFITAFLCIMIKVFIVLAVLGLICTIVGLLLAL